MSTEGNKVLVLPRTGVKDLSGKLVPKPDKRRGKRKKMLVNLIEQDPQSYASMFSAACCRVPPRYVRTDEVHPSNKVTATGLCRLPVRDEALNQNARRAATEAQEQGTFLKMGSILRTRSMSAKNSRQ